METALEVREWILSWEQFSPLVRQQILTMTVMFVCGLVIGAFRMIDRAAVGWLERGCRRRKPWPVTLWFLEVLFWILAGLCAAEFLYYCAYGALSFHGLVAMTFGFFLWRKVFAGQILGWCGIIKRSIGKKPYAGEFVHGKNETKPLVQKRARKQRHQHR
ncbi:MAG: hypothetical protein J6S45_03200 [Firmicutes bacterium]|nr:hypothetical protein [Bacillota bacterium]